jgi:putative nucleotidyltransferase with HDIG domain
MAVPDPEEARRILAARSLPDGIVRHSEGVARVAAEAARLVAASGIPVDVGLVEAAAVLHDIDKPATRRGAGLPHGEAGARLLEQMGFGELAPAVAAHPVPALLDEDRFPRGWEPVILNVADKHVAQGFMTIDERLDDMARRYPRYEAEIEAARRPAHALEREIADAVGLSVDDLVERLRAAWHRGDGS